MYSKLPLLLLRFLATPAIVQSPVESIEVIEGETVVLSCSATGNPKPFLRWRHDWNIPFASRVTATSNDGLGFLTILDARTDDQGAWTCEAINPKGSVLSPYDSILLVKCK